MPAKNERLSRLSRNRVQSWHDLGLFKRESLAREATVDGSLVSGWMSHELKRVAPLGALDALYGTLTPEELGIALRADAETHGEGRVHVTVDPPGGVRRKLGSVVEECGDVQVVLGELLAAHRRGASAAEIRTLEAQLLLEAREAGAAAAMAAK